MHGRGRKWKGKKVEGKKGQVSLRTKGVEEKGKKITLTSHHATDSHLEGNLNRKVMFNDEM